MRTRGSARCTAIKASSVPSRLPSSTKTISAGSAMEESTPDSAAWHSRIMASPLLKTGMTIEITIRSRPLQSGRSPDVRSSVFAGRHAGAQGVHEKPRRRRGVGRSRNSNAVVPAAPDLRAGRRDECAPRRLAGADLERQIAERSAVDGKLEPRRAAGRLALGPRFQIDRERRAGGHVERDNDGAARSDEVVSRTERIAGAVLPAVEQEALAPVVQRQVHLAAQRLGPEQIVAIDRQPLA